MQLFDYQHFPVQWGQKSNVTHVTRARKWHQWHEKNKHMSLGSIDIQRITTPVQWVQCIFKPKKIIPLTKGARGMFHPHGKHAFTKNKYAKAKQKIAFTYPPILLQLLPHSSSRIKNVSSTLVPINYFLSKDLCLLLHSLAFSTAVSSWLYLNVKIKREFRWAFGE